MAKGRKLSKYAIGTIHSTKNHGDVVVTEIHGSKVVVEFKNTGACLLVDKGNLGRGNILDPSRKGGKYKVGSLHPTIHHGYFEVLEFTDMYNMTIKFLNTGNIKVINGTNIRTGYISDK